MCVQVVEAGHLQDPRPMKAMLTKAKSRDSTSTAAASLISPKLYGPPTGLTNPK